MRPKPKIPFLFVPRSFFAPNPHGNACYAAYGVAYGKWSRIYPQGFLPRRRPNTSTSWDRMYYTQFLSYDIRGFSQRPHEKWGESNIRLKPKIPVLVVPPSFFAPNPHGNACYAAYTGSLTGSGRESTHGGSFLEDAQTHLRLEIECITLSF